MVAIASQGPDPDAFCARRRASLRNSMRSGMPSMCAHLGNPPCAIDAAAQRRVNDTLETAQKWAASSSR